MPLSDCGCVDVPRLLRMTARYDVQPALNVTPTLTPSHQDLHKHLLRLDLDNTQVVPACLSLTICPPSSSARCSCTVHW